MDSQYTIRFFVHPFEWLVDSLIHWTDGVKNVSSTKNYPPWKTIPPWKLCLRHGLTQVMSHQSLMAPSGERLRGRGRYDVFCIVWFIPERLKCEPTINALYKSTYLFQGNRKWHYSTYKFLLMFHGISMVLGCITSEIRRYIGRNSRFFPHGEKLSHPASGVRHASFSVKVDLYSA